MWFRRTVNAVVMDYGECAMPKDGPLIPDERGVLGVPLMWGNPQDGERDVRLITPEKFGCVRFVRKG